MRIQDPPIPTGLRRLGDFRRSLPKYQPEVLEKNLQLVEKLQEIAKRKGDITLPQLGIAWVRHFSGKPGMPLVIPIPGATTEARVNENLKDVSITDEEFKEIGTILESHGVKGDRYGGPAQAHIEA